MAKCADGSAHWMKEKLVHMHGTLRPLNDMSVISDLVDL